MNESALKARLKYIAKQKNQTFNQVWKQLLLERFLARLSNSEYQTQFVFKGGLLLAQYLEIGRETIDIDFSARNISGEEDAVKSIIQNICEITIDDGFNFQFDNIVVLEQPHMDYEGFRISAKAQFGTMRDKILIDIAFGDIVNAIENSFNLFEYKGKPMFIGEITLQIYPVNAILAEKLESIISRGALNSRMKDYHDILLIIRYEELYEVSDLKETINIVFTQRNTPVNFPLNFDGDSLQNLQALWSNHLRGLGDMNDSLKLPVLFEEVVGELNRWGIEMDIFGFELA